MYKLHVYDKDGESLSLDIFHCDAPTVNDLWPDFADSHSDAAVRFANEYLAKAKVVTEADAGRSITVWCKTLRDGKYECTAEDYTVTVDGVRFDPWKEYEQYEIDDEDDED